MKRVVSISLGSSKRNHAVEVEIMGQNCRVERIGTDGDMQKMMQMIEQLDGEVNAFGLGGMDLYVYAGTKRYTLRDAKKITSYAKKTPIVDGSGLKNTLERNVINYLNTKTDIFANKPPVLMVSGVDRFGMAQALNEIGCPVAYGDLVFVIGLPLPLRTLKALERAAHILAPIVVQLPLKLLYPTGKKQEERKPKAKKLFNEAKIIAGDYHFIRRYMPEDMQGKIIITNTTTENDVKLLKSCGVEKLITTTPELDGRSFGTNVMEALLVALSGENRELLADEYDVMLSKISFTPRILTLNEES